MARQMPQNLEAEMSVLGVAFIDNSEVNKIVEEVVPEMFFDERNKAIFNAIKSLHDAGTPVDIMTMKNELDKDKKLSFVGIEYLSEVIDSVVTTANLDYYITIIKDFAIRRNLIATATQIVTDSYDFEDLNYLLDNAEKKITNVVRERSVGDLVPISEVLRRAHERLEEKVKNKGGITGLETGLTDFDKITTGFQPGEMIILAARPSVGKTALALNMAMNAAKKTKKAIAIFNMEMPAEEIANRLISAAGQIDGYKLQTGKMHDNDWKRYNEALSQLAETNIYIEDNMSATIQEIRAKCRRLEASKEGLGLVVIDYLQLINSGYKHNESRQVEVSEISRSIKTMALELKVPVLALSQLSRTVERREGNEPMLADLRESGSIEQDADIVLFINRKDYHEKIKDEKVNIVPVELVIAKHRKGSRGRVDLLFELATGSFRNMLQENKEES